MSCFTNLMFVCLNNAAGIQMQAIRPYSIIAEEILTEKRNTVTEYDFRMVDVQIATMNFVERQIVSVNNLNR